MADRPDRWARHRTRVALVQAVFQWLFAAPTSHELESQFAMEGKLDKVDREFFRAALRGILHGREALDAKLAPCLDREVAELGRLEHAVLLLGCYELEHMLETPYRVVISEAVGIAKDYGAAESHRFVNAVLDKLADQLRPTETAASRAS